MAELPLFVEFHVLSSHSPSNLNRDDLGTPKTAVFGGERRLRISSQCLKRTWRTSSFFRGELAEEELGIRTALLPQLVIEKLGPGYDDRARQGLVALLLSIGKKSGGGKDGGEPADAGEDETEEGNDETSSASTEAVPGKTAHLLYLSRQEVDEVIAFADERAAHLGKIVKVTKKKAGVDPEALKAERKKLQEHLERTCERNAVDIGLFGRFVTSDEISKVDAALQVAHALGTQKVELEYDYFTAVDDLSNETGAGHLGETEFAASVFYKYAVCDYRALVRNLGGDAELAKRGLKAIAQAMARAVPIGKKNSTAPHNPADYVEVVLRQDAPLSLANAFLKPVRPQGDKGDVMDISIERLREQAKKYDEAYGKAHIVDRFALSLREGGDVKSLNDLVEKLGKRLDEAGGR